MSIIFVVLGLGFLAGGAYAVVEGWPYVLIERGFTLVITGTVLMTAGVVMLALSRVMAELRRVREQLSGAVMAISVASMGQVREEREHGASPPSPARSASDADRPGLAPVAIGGALAAGGVLAAGMAVAAARETSVPGHDRPEDTVRDDEPDLFAVPAAAESEPPSAREGDWTPWPEAEPASAPEERGDAAPETPATEIPDDFEAALMAATTEALSQAPAGAEALVDRDPLVVPAIAVKEFDTPDSGTSHPVDEDFDRLRDRLGFGGERADWEDDGSPALSGERREPTGNEIDAASDWMTAIRPGRERWVAEPQPEPESAPDVPAEPPVWPPQTREAAPFALEQERAEHAVKAADSEEAGPHGMTQPSEPEDDAAPEPQPLPTFALLPDPSPALDPEPDAEAAPEIPAEPDRSAEPDPAPSPEPAELAPPAASEEGIVGAYQVGTAHFTIYADGSIQARTPDGDYSFASMDELKTYLASEKNRIGA